MKREPEPLPQLRLRATAKGYLRRLLPSCLVLVFLVWRLGLAPDHHLTAIAWIEVGVTVALVGSFIPLIARPSVLVLDAEDLTWQGGARRGLKTRWGNILEFGGARGRYGSDRLGLNYRLGVGPYDPTTQASIRQTLGYDVVMPEIFPMSLQELLATRQRYLDASKRNRPQPELRLRRGSGLPARR